MKVHHERGSRRFVAVHQAGDCDGRAVSDLLSDAAERLLELEGVWVRQVVLEVDHLRFSDEVSLIVFYDDAEPHATVEPAEA